MSYDKFKLPGGGDSESGGKYLKLKEVLLEKGDSIRLKCLTSKKIPREETYFKNCNNWEWEVLHKDEEGNVSKKIWTVDAPDEANEFKGSQAYRGMASNNIEPGDIFVIEHGGKMNNQYKTTIYDISKEMVSDKGDIKADTAGEMTTEEIAETINPEEEVRIEDMNL